MNPPGGVGSPPSLLLQRIDQPVGPRHDGVGMLLGGGCNGIGLSLNGILNRVGPLLRSGRVLVGMKVTFLQIVHHIAGRSRGRSHCPVERRLARTRGISSRIAAGQAGEHASGELTGAKMHPSLVGVFIEVGGQAASLQPRRQQGILQLDVDLDGGDAFGSIAEQG